MTPRKILPYLVLPVSLALLGFAPIQDTQDEGGFVPLFNGKDVRGFKAVLPKDKDATDGIFFVKDDAITRAADSWAYLHTEKSYKNYVLRFETKHPNQEKSRGGYWVHIGDEGKLLIGGTESRHGEMSQYDPDVKAQEKAIRPGEWNTIEIISQDGRITCKVNGTQVCTGKTEWNQGKIGWNFPGEHPPQVKNIRIKEMP